MRPPAKRSREQVVVYLEPRDRELLEKLASATGLSRTELFRRGLWALAARSRNAEASAFEQLISSAASTSAPPDLSERADDYLYGGKYAELAGGRPAVAEKAPAQAGSLKRGARKRARSR